MDDTDKEPEVISHTNDFLARLGLETDPFPAETDASFYYENPDLMQRLDMIQHLIGFSNQMIFVTGEQGIGKTSMLERLEYYAPDHWRICRIQANPMLNTPILLRQLTSGFDLEIAADADDMFQVYSEALQDHIETLERAMLTPVVLIDDAHELPVDAFTMLFGFMQQEGGHSRMKMALFCEPQILTMLDSPQLKTLSQNLTHQLEIPPFDEQQTGEYLEQRLNHAGLTGDFPFRTETVQKIYRQSQGIAGKIHTLAQQTLLDEDTQINDDTEPLPVVDEILDFDEEEIGEDDFPAMSSRNKLENTSPIGKKFHSWQIGAVAVVLALLAGVLWLTSQLGDSPEPEIAEEIPLDITPKTDTSEQTTTAVQDPTLFEEPASSQTAMTEGPVPEATEQLPSTNQAPVPENPESLAANTSEPKGNTGDPLDALVQTIEEQHNNDAARTDQQQNVTAVEKDEHGKPQTAEIHNQETTESVATTMAPVIEQPPESTTSIAKTTPETIPVVTKTDPVEKPVISGIKGEAWLRNQQDDQVVLQLLGTHDQQALSKILSENTMGDDVAWFTTVHNGEPWYVVVKGPFSNRASATASIATLPADIKRRKPWPRTIASVKKAMDEAP